MKKFITFIAAIVVCFSAFAQEWSIKFHEADELKGASSYTSYAFFTDEGAFICWDNDDDVKVCVRHGIFDYDDNYVFAIVGFYKDGSLVEKVTTYMYVPSGDSDTAYTSEYKTQGLGKKIKSHLRDGGNVRFIVSKYSGPDFDLIVTSNAKIK